MHWFGIHSVQTTRQEFDSVSLRLNQTFPALLAMAGNLINQDICVITGCRKSHLQRKMIKLISCSLQSLNAEPTLDPATIVFFCVLMSASVMVAKTDPSLLKLEKSLQLTSTSSIFYSSSDGRCSDSSYSGSDSLSEESDDTGSDHNDI